MAALWLANGPNSSAANFTQVVPVVDAFYAGNYSAVDIGPPPVVGDGEIGALTFKDAQTLYFDVNTFQASATIEAVTVVRGAGQHIVGFSGVGTRVANAPYMDGGLLVGPNGVIFYTAYPVNQLGQIKPGSVKPDKITDLTPLGISSSVGSVAMVPRGFGGAGGLKLISWDAKTWYGTYLSPDTSGTFTVSASSHTGVPLGSVNWEGMVFIQAGQPLFPNNSVLINADLAEAIYAFTLDNHGNPITNTKRLFMAVGDPVGMASDPVTGDVLITSEQGPIARHVTVLQGFGPPASTPAPSVATSKSVYATGETVVVNFSNAFGGPQEWIGLYSLGAVNSGYLKWTYTDGTSIGSNGRVNGSVSFSGGLPNAGTYQARLFYAGDYNIQATATFTVGATVTPEKVLIITSSNPTSGVGIRISPPDRNGAGDGTTSLTRFYLANTTATVTAPLMSGGSTFLKWQRDGVDFSTSPSTSITVDENHVLNAVYVPTRTLIVLSSNPRSLVPVRVGPSDNNGIGNGNTPLNRMYPDGATVTVAAPASAGGNSFKKWQLDGVDYTTNLRATVTLSSDHTLNAIY